MSGLVAGAASVNLNCKRNNGESDAALKQVGTPAETAVAAKHACKGQNACKGQGGCSSGDNGCKGKNSCKGKGGCAT